MNIELIVIGASAGGLKALSFMLRRIPADFQIPLVVVLHISKESDDYWIRNLNDVCSLNVKEAEDKEVLGRGYIYLAPPNYHVLVDFDRTLTLSIDDKVNYSRPSIDVLFESASGIYKEKLMGIVLTGSSADGARGLKMIKYNGGITVVQNPSEAEYKYMPEEALKASVIDYVLPLEEIMQLISSLNQKMS